MLILPPATGLAKSYSTEANRPASRCFEPWLSISSNPQAATHRLHVYIWQISAETKSGHPIPCPGSRHPPQSSPSHRNNDLHPKPYIAKKTHRRSYPWKIALNHLTSATKHSLTSGNQFPLIIHACILILTASLDTTNEIYIYPSSIYPTLTHMQSVPSSSMLHSIPTF